MVYPTGILVDTQTGRFHPIVFRRAPRPSEYGEDVQRYKSKGHHTIGFAEQKDATKWIEETDGLVNLKETQFWDSSIDPIPAISWMISAKDYQ